MKRILSLLILALILGGLIAWRIQAKVTEQAAQAQAVQARRQAPSNVTVIPATLRDIVHTYVGVGSAEAPFNVKIAAQVTGLLQYLQLREGDAVRVGDVVARIDPSSFQAQVAQQQANVAAARQRLTQAELTANPTNMQVTTSIRQQRAGLTSSQANYNQVRENFDAQVATAQSAVTDAQARVDNARAAVNNANAAIASARAYLVNAQKRYDRTDALYKQGFVAQQDVDDAHTQVQVYQSALDQQQAQLSAAQASVDSANAQKQSAQHQLSIAITKGKADIEAALAVMNQSHAALDYARSNTAQRPAYQANLAALRAAVRAAEAQLHDAEAQLAYTVLRSSINGYVTARLMDPGAVATAGQGILTLVSIKPIFMTTTAPEEVSRQVRLGEEAQVTFDALPGRTFAARITQVNPAADPQSRQFMVRVTLDNAQGLIKPGMFGRVIIETERYRNLVVVPHEAVVGKKDDKTVAVVDADNVAHLVPVKIGPEDTAGIAITGVKAGQRVVTLSQAPVKDGQKVNVGVILPSAAAPSAPGGADGVSAASSAGGTRR
jgi:multidrug efflux pump subunit AcrA (membrane-fusion protein)